MDHNPGLGPSVANVLRVEVADTGPTIAPEDHSKLFKPFTQLNGNAGGTGLGLAGIKQKTEALGTQCDSASNNGHGNIFWFTFPFLTEGTAPVQAIGGMPVGLDADMGVTTAACVNASQVVGLHMLLPPEKNKTPSVLVIDDTRMFRTILNSGLSKEGFQVVEAEDGIEGLRRLKESEYFLVICDQEMPRMNGDECTKSFREWEAENRSSRQLIWGMFGLVDADPHNKKIMKMVEAGMDCVLGKTTKVKDLVQLMQHAPFAPLKAVKTELVEC